LLNVTYFSLTVFLESFSKDESTGGIRGVFLTILNVAILAGPLIASGVLGVGNYQNAFVIAAILVLPIIFLAARHLRDFADPTYSRISFLQSAGAIMVDKSLRYIFVIQFLLQFFYGIMVIYTPIYLHTRMGIPLSEILGIIMPIALLPFVIFPYLIGNLADKKLGEKEMLLTGFAIISLTTIGLSFIHSNAVLVWAGALFVTRVGATFIETMAESYFFKHVDASGTHVISFFRNLTSFSYLISPVVASTFLSLFDYRFIFLGLGLVMLIGLRYSFLLKDTR
jgi:MFS family permease